MAIKLRLGLVALTAMLCRLNALGATTGCRVVEDDRSTTVQAQDGGLSSTFTVKRIVGPGTSSEIDSLGKLLNPDPYLLGASPVLSRNGCITFSGRIKLDPQYYYFVKSQYQFKGTILPIAFSFGTGVPLGGVALPLNFRDRLIY